MAQRNHVLALGVDLRQQNRGLVGFGAAVGKERFLQSARRDLGQLLSQIDLRLIGVERRHMLEFTILLVDRFGDLCH